MSFHLTYSFLCCSKALSLTSSHFFTFFNFCYSRRWVTEDLALIYVIECSMFSSKSFIVSSFKFRSLIHFEYIFVYGVRKCSNLILLHVTVQFSQHHLLKRPSLPHYIFLPPLSKKKLPIDAWVYFWLSILFHWSVFLFLCQYHTILMTIAL